MNAIQNFLLILFLSTTYSKPQYSDFLVGTRCITRANEVGVCKYYKNCQHLVEKVKNRQVKQEDIFKCNSQGIICCTSDAPATTTTLSAIGVIDTDIRLQSRSDRIGTISEESKIF